MTEQQEAKRARASHIFERDEHDHYVEEQWCSERLFQEESFDRMVVYDPCCGWGQIPQAARDRNIMAIGSDIVSRPMLAKASNVRGSGFIRHVDRDFLKDHGGLIPDAIVTNPPFNLIREITEKALEVAVHKVAILCPLRRLPAAWPWLENTPLVRVWLMTPRPSMPTGEHILRGGKVGGGTQDFVWLVFDKQADESDLWLAPQMRWLHRDPGEATP